MAERGPSSQTYELPSSAPFSNHGKTRASWTLIWSVTFGVLVVGLGMIFSQLWLIIVGLVVVVAGLVIGAVMGRMGLGQPRDAAEPRNRDWYS